MKNFWLVLVLIATLSGCATGDLIQKVDTGMKKEEVIAVLGAPDGVRQEEGAEYLIYVNRLMSSWSWDRADYLIELKNGLVTQYQPINVKEMSQDQRQSLMLMGLMGQQMMNNANQPASPQYRIPVTCRTYSNGITTCQ